MLVRLGYVAMSMHLQNASPSQTMTFARFSRMKDQEAAVRKIEAKQKDETLLQLMRDLTNINWVEIVDGASFYVK
jgi:UV DNA damage endonuclease